MALACHPSTHDVESTREVTVDPAWGYIEYPGNDLEADSLLGGVWLGAGVASSSLWGSRSFRDVTSRFEGGYGWRVPPPPRESRGA